MKHLTWLRGIGTGVFLVLLGTVLQLTAVGVMAAPAMDGPIVIDHTSTDITAIPQEWIEAAKANLHIAYGHTSHGSQLTDGMAGLVAFANGHGLGLTLPEDIFQFSSSGNQGGTHLHLFEGSGYDPGDMELDVGYSGWVNETCDYLGSVDGNGRGGNHPEINVIIWSWCGQVSGHTEQTMIDSYLAPMSQLEEEYWGVTFVYMTGHSDGVGETSNLHLRNQQIREYAIANNKVLYDFYNIELYDPDGAYYGDKNTNDNCDYDSDGDGSLDSNWATAWQNSHTQDVDWYNCGCAHSDANPLNCNQKAYAAWALWARLAGWDGTSGDRLASDSSDNWNSAGTWDGNRVPGAGDAVTITAGTTVNVAANAHCHRLTVEQGATLVIADGVTLTVDGDIDNRGTMRQTRAVNNTTAAFLEIADSEGFVRYRGVEITTVADLGLVTASVRGLSDEEHCTSSGAGSPAYARRCFEITSSLPGAATVRLWALTSEIPVDITAPQVYHYVAPNWTALSGGAATGAYGVYTYVQANTPGFSHFLIAQSGDAPTAVEPVALHSRSVDPLLIIGTPLCLLLGVGIFVVARKLRRLLPDR